MSLAALGVEWMVTLPTQMPPGSGRGQQQPEDRARGWEKQDLTCRPTGDHTESGNYC